MTTQTSVRALNPSGNNNEALILPRRSGYAADGAPGHVGHSEQDYWFALIDERAAAEFLGLTDRTMQGLRYRHGLRTDQTFPTNGESYDDLLEGMAPDRTGRAGGISDTADVYFQR